jgi:hypothetical protein
MFSIGLVGGSAGNHRVDWVFRLGGIKVWSADRRKVDGGRAAFDEGSGGQVQVGWAFMLLGAIKVWSADWQDIYRSGRETNDGSSDFGGESL